MVSSLSPYFRNNGFIVITISLTLTGFTPITMSWTLVDFIFPFGYSVHSCYINMLTILSGLCLFINFPLSKIFKVISFFGVPSFLILLLCKFCKQILHLYLWECHSEIAFLVCMTFVWTWCDQYVHGAFRRIISGYVFGLWVFKLILDTGPIIVSLP